MTKKTHRRVEHKIAMALVCAEGGSVSIECMHELQQDAHLIRIRIEAEYDRRRGAGALWLDSKLKNKDWLYNMQSAVLANG